MEAYRVRLAKLDKQLRDAFCVGELDPDWKRKERELLAEAHKLQEGKK